VIVISSNTLDFDLRPIDATYLFERRHRITRRSSDNLPRGLFTLKSPKKQSASGRPTPLSSIPLLCYGGRKENSAENSPASVSGQFRFPMAPVASYDFHVDEQAAIAAKRAFSPPPSLSLSLSLSLTAEERRVYSLKRDYPSFAGQRIFPPRDSSFLSSYRAKSTRGDKKKRAYVFVHVAYTCELVRTSSA